MFETDKTHHKTEIALMGHLKAGAPWDVLAVDLLGAVANRGNR